MCIDVLELPLGQGQPFFLGFTEDFTEWTYNTNVDFPTDPGLAQMNGEIVAEWDEALRNTVAQIRTLGGIRTGSRIEPELLVTDEIRRVMRGTDWDQARGGEVEDSPLRWMTELSARDHEREEHLGLDALRPCNRNGRTGGRRGQSYRLRSVHVLVDHGVHAAGDFYCDPNDVNEQNCHPDAIDAFFAPDPSTSSAAFNSYLQNAA